MIAENTLLFCKIEKEDCKQYTGDLPDDFFQTVGFGKYSFIGGQIAAVDGWEMPEQQPLFFNRNN